MADVRAITADKLAGLDEDILDYIVGTIEDPDTPKDEAQEAVREFLLSTGFVETEEAAEARVAELFAALGGGAEPAPAEAPTNATPAKLESAVKIGGGLQEEAASEWNADFGKMEINDVLEKKKAKRVAARKATREAYERVRKQQEEMEKALEAAKERAVQLRAAEGAYLGAVESKPFSLPNPGGGPDLLENASFTLVRGRRYGLIGRNGKGKSTLLRGLASRQVGGIPDGLTVHYVSQEVHLSEEAMGLTAVALVIDADVERRLLMAEAAALQASEKPDVGRLQARNPSAQFGAIRRNSVDAAPPAGRPRAPRRDWRGLGRAPRDQAAAEPGLFARAACTAVLGALRRLAGARRAGGGDVRAPRPAAPRRADEPPVDWRGALARARAAHLRRLEGAHHVRRATALPPAAAPRRRV